MTKEEYNEKINTMDKCVEYWMKKAKNLEKENAELKADNDARKFAMAMSEKVEKQLREENAELKRIVKMVAMINKDIYTEEGIKAIYAEAEQFLKEE